MFLQKLKPKQMVSVAENDQRELEAVKGAGVLAKDGHCRQVVLV
jgi:hypothetical protein